MDRGHRSDRTVSNIFWGTVNKFINIVFPFVIRTIMIYVLGSEYLGLNTLFSSILQVLNLAEMGLSSAIVYSMYEPMAHDNTDMVCALLSVYKKLYRFIGMTVLAIGIIIATFLPHLIKGGYPNDVNLYLLYFIFLINTVISYLFSAYKTSIWNASQRISMVDNVRSVVTILQNVIQVAALLLIQNYYAYIVIMPICTLANNLFISIVTKKYYPQYVCKGRISKTLAGSIAQRVKGLFVTRLCTTTRNALDSVFISSMIGLEAVAIYGNYYYIMSSIFGIISIIITSMTASVGNSLVTESIQKNYEDMRKFDFGFSWIAGFCTVCLLCLYQPFMQIWVGDQMVYPFHMVLLFCTYFYSLCLGSVRSAYHDAAGLWWEARYRAVAETMVNVILNLVLTYLWGAAGTVVSTIISILLINFGYGTSIVFKFYFKGISMKQYYMDHLQYTLITVAVALVTYLCCSVFHLGGLLEIVKNLIICLIIPNILFAVVYRNNVMFRQNLQFAKKILLR